MSTALLRQIHKQDQQELADRYNGESLKLYDCEWLIMKLRHRLAPEHVATAHHLLGLQAIVEGARQISERVDDTRNGAALATDARIDAARTLAGYEGAVASRLLTRGVRCLRAIYEGCSMHEARRRMGYRSDASHPIAKLVQLTMLTAQDYRDECTAQLERWRAM